MKDIEAVVAEDEKRLHVIKLVDQGIALDKRMKEDKKALDAIKAELQAIAYEDMENKNLKWVQFFGSEGQFNVGYKEKFELDDYATLISLLGDKAKSKIVRKEEVKYEIDARFKAALIALFKGDHDKTVSVEAVLIGLGLDSKKVKTTAKKLKGDYLKDKQVLEAVGITGPLEEELDAIRLYRNHELVDRFVGSLPPEAIDRLKKAVFVEDGLSVGLEYEKPS